MSSGAVEPCRLFNELWRKLGECHHHALQELEEKVKALRKERCLDAQKLEDYFNCNRQLKEQNTSLQDAISQLEERLRAGQCARCTSFKQNLKNSQDKNLQIITKLKSEKSTLEDKNRTTLTELKIKTQSTDSSSEQEDGGIIPDSPIFTNSHPVGSKLKKHKKIDKNIRYAEKPLSGFHKSLFNEAVCTMKEDEQDEVLVLNTCEEDVSQNLKGVEVDAEVIADTCVFDFPKKHPMKADKTTSQQNKYEYDCKLNAPARTSSRISSPDSASESSRSLFPVAKHSLHAGKHTAEQKQKSTEEQVQDVADMQKDKHMQSEVMNQTSRHVRSQSLKRKPMDEQEEPGKLRNSSQDQTDSYLSPVFKKPNTLFKREVKAVGTKSLKRENPKASHDQPAPKHAASEAETIHQVEPTWSVDPALTLSTYDSDRRGEQAEEEVEEEEAELIDSDCTWVSHSLLQGRGQNNNWGDGTSRLGQKANDSLEMMFDKTVDEEYMSFIGDSQPCADDDDEEEEEIKETHEDPPEKTKAPAIPYPHIAVVRRKDERRKLKGTTCKECETYYSHLPEEEKQKKLAACSRHRFHYIPPCTPENFWEVGFPSTQTCIERGYIREEEKPQERLRRRRPFSALFSPKNSLEQS